MDDMNYTNQMACIWIIYMVDNRHHIWQFFCWWCDARWSAADLIVDHWHPLWAFGWVLSLHMHKYYDCPATGVASLLHSRFIGIETTYYSSDTAMEDHHVPQANHKPLKFHRHVQRVGNPMQPTFLAQQSYHWSSSTDSRLLLVVVHLRGLTVNRGLPTAMNPQSWHFPDRKMPIFGIKGHIRLWEYLVEKNINERNPSQKTSHIITSRIQQVQSIHLKHPTFDYRIWNPGNGRLPTVPAAAPWSHEFCMP